MVIFDTFRNMIYKHFIGYFFCGCCVLNLLIVATLESFFSPMESGQDPNVQFTGEQCVGSRDLRIFIAFLRLRLLVIFLRW